MKFTERHRAWLDPTALFLLALGVRLIYISLISGHPYFETLVLDAQAYESRAREILQGIWTAGGVFYQDPFYPYFLALIHKVAGPGLGAVRMVHAVLGALGAVLVYDLGCFLGGRRTGVLAGLIYILYGALAYYDGLIGKDGPGLFLITMALAVLFRASGRRGPWAWLAAGAALGLAALTRGNLLLLVPLFGLWILLAFAGSLRTRLAEAALFVLGFVLMISPVTLHNWLAGRDLVLLTSQAGQNFYIGNNPRASGFFEHPDRIRLTPEFEEQDFRQEALRLTGRSDMRPSEVSSFWMRRGLDYALTHPGRTLKRLWIKTVMFFNDFEIPDNYNLYFARQQVRFLRFLPLSFGLIASLGLVGLAMLWPDRRRFWLPAIFLAGYLISIVPFHMASRYRLPVVTILIALAAFFVARLVAMLRERNWPAAAKMAAPAAVLLVLCHWPMYDPAATFDAPYMALGLAEADAGRPEQALRLYWSALDVNPDFAPAYYNLGNAFLALERYDRAESAFSRAIELDPYLVQAYLNLGSLYLDRDRTREAQQTFRSALTRLPRSAEAWLGLGLSLHKQGIYNQAIDAFTSALQIAPGLAAAHYNLACALARSGRPEAAWPHLKTAARLDPSLAAQAAEDPDLLSLGQGDDMRKRLGEQS